MEHGVQERFTPDGKLQWRYHYAHGKPEGVQVSYYEGLLQKQSETTYAAGEEHGLSRTWSPKGMLLFEGTSRNGMPLDGWFYEKSSSSSGGFHRQTENWTITEWKQGKKIPKSTREVKAAWRTWTPGTLPDQKLFLRWKWPEYAVDSTYPFLDHMPAYQDVPLLMEVIRKKGDGHKMAQDQLTALTRVQFGDSFLQSDEERIVASQKWNAWWEDVGKHRPEQQKEHGVRDAAAWDLVQKGRKLPMPDEPMLIPSQYVLKVTYRSGDYMGVTQETLTLKRNHEGAELIRSYSTLKDGPVTEERWTPFTIGEADKLVRALGYLIDRPWLLNDEAQIEKLYWESEKKSEGESLGAWCAKKVKGRESYHSPYYPDVEYELRDGERRLWWNADPVRWYGANPERFNMANQPVSSTVFPFLAAHYPESARHDPAGKAGWKAR